MSNEQNMDDFKAELDASFRQIKEGDLVHGIVVDASETGILVDLNYYTEGYIPAEEVSNDPSFSIHCIHPQDEVTALVLQRENEDGQVLLSLRQAADLLAWDELTAMFEHKKVFSVKISSAVNAGVIAYVNDIRAFIPASLLDSSYVEDVSEYVGKTLDVIITTVDADKKKLILSHKDVIRMEAEMSKADKLSHLQKGIVTKGVVDKIAPYGAFVSIGDGLSGLVHISQICGKHLKSPNEVLKLGDEVTVKIMDIKDGKISLSMTAALDTPEDVVEDVTEIPFSYSSGEEATTGLGALLKNIKL